MDKVNIRGHMSQRTFWSQSWFISYFHIPVSNRKYNHVKRLYYHSFEQSFQVLLGALKFFKLVRSMHRMGGVGRIMEGAVLTVFTLP